MIDVQHLTKRYGSHVAVDDASFECLSGTVTGFLGPNGAGKSTTLRMLTGLTPRTSGSVAIAGRAYRDLPNPGRTVGVMLDASAQHPGRTGLETLRLAARLQAVPMARAEATLERVGLDGAGSKRVGRYSLGMRQRLGIGAALLGDPEVLVLDEPANGMDPEGIRWMRHLLRGFADAGGTVLLSSHLLAEVQATADRLVVIDRGRIVAQETLADLVAAQGTLVRGVDPTGLGRALTAAGLHVRPTDDDGLQVAAAPEEVGRVAAADGQVLVELRSADATVLEDAFFRLTSATA